MKSVKSREKRKLKTQLTVVILVSCKEKKIDLS